jgi:lysophospholipase L1-like esterase
MSWALVVNDNFSRANTSPGGAGTTAGAGNGWVDVHGGVFQIVSNQLKGTGDGIDNNSWSRDFLLRPSSENHADQQIISTIPVGAPSSAGYWNIHRYNNLGTQSYYAILYDPGTPKIQVYAINGTSPTQIGSNIGAGYNSGHSYSWTTSVTGGVTPVISWVLTDITTSTVVSSGSVTDSSAVGPLGSGQYGVVANSPSSSSGVILWSNIATYYQSTATISVLPSSVMASTVGNSLAIIGTGTSFSGTPFAASGGTITAQSVTSSTSATLTYSAPSSAGTVTLTDTGSSATTPLTINAVPATDFTLTPSSLSATVGSPTSNYTVTPNATPSTSTTIALTDGGAGGTFLPMSLIFTTSTSQTFTYTPAFAGTKTLTATASGGLTNTHTASCVASTGPVTLSVTDANWFFSPYNWYFSGSSYAAASAPGAYFKIKFSATSGDSAVLNVQVSQIPSTMPKVRWSLDGGVFTVASLSGTTLSLATGLTMGNHTIELYLMATQGGAGWSSLTNVLWVTGLTIGAGASSVSQTLSSKRALFYGDSITQGTCSTGNATQGVAGDDSILSYAAYLGIALGAEYGALGYTGEGYTIASAGGAGPPALFTPGNDANSSWNKYWAGNSRLTAGIFSPVPDYIFVVLGRNDYNQSGSGVTAAVSGFLTAARTAAPSAWIFIVIPFDGSCRSVITAGFNNYRMLLVDTKAALLDTQTDVDFNLSLSQGGDLVPTFGSIDGTHPNYQLHGILGARVATLAQTAITSASNSNSLTNPSHQLKRAR